MLSYLITDPQYYTNTPTLFKQKLSNVLKNNKVDISCFRDKVSSNTKELAATFVEVCKKHNIQTILINSDINLALQLKATGVHLNSKQFDKIKIAKENNLFTIISCHTLDEVKQAQEKGANMVTYSPIFSTPNKGKPKGCDNLKSIIQEVNIPVIALGGIISQEQIEKCEKAKAKGFASIRYFVD